MGWQRGVGVGGISSVFGEATTKPKGNNSVLVYEPISMNLKWILIRTTPLPLAKQNPPRCFIVPNDPLSQEIFVPHL